GCGRAARAVGSFLSADRLLRALRRKAGPPSAFATGGPRVLKPERGTGSGRNSCTGRGLKPEPRALGLVPLKDLRTGPKQCAARSLDVLDGASEIFEALRRTHDVGVHHEGHHARRVAGVMGELRELINGAVGVFGRLVMLDEHHGNVVAFLRVGYVDDR